MIYAKFSNKSAFTDGNRTSMLMVFLLSQNIMRTHAASHCAAEFPLRLERFGVEVRSGLSSVEAIYNDVSFGRWRVVHERNSHLLIAKT